MSLLEEYIAMRNRNFCEPHRKGIQKGYAIGVHLSRYKAATYSLYGCEQKEIAEKAGVTYAFLRKLRTEDSFKDYITEVQEDFAEKHLYTYLKAGNYKTHREITTSDLDINNYIMPDDAFEDVAEYSPDLKQIIAKYIIFKCKQIGLTDIMNGKDRVFDLLTRWKEPELNKEIFIIALKLSNDLICSTLEDADSTNEMRSKAIACSHFIQRLSILM